MHDRSLDCESNMSENGEFKDKDSTVSILNDLLDNFKRDDGADSGNDSDVDGECDSSESDYKSLISALSTCRIDDELKKSPAEKTKTSTTTSTIKMTKMHIAVKSRVRPVRSDVEELEDKLSSLQLNNLSKSKKHDESESRSDDSSERSPRIVLVERGPIRCGVNDPTVRAPPYQNRQVVHRKALSGGKMLLNEEPVLTDMIPTTVNDKLELDLRLIFSNFTSTTKPPTDIDSDVLDSIMEILDKNDENEDSVENDDKRRQVQDIERYLSESHVFDQYVDMGRNVDNSPSLLVDVGGEESHSNEYNLGIGLLQSQSIESNTGSFLDINSIPDSGVFSASASSNPSPYGYSPVQGFYSPATESPDKLATNDNNDTNNKPWTYRNSYSSVSSSDSSNLQLHDETFIFQTDVCGSVFYDSNENNLSPISNVSSDYGHSMYSPNGNNAFLDVDAHLVSPEKNQHIVNNNNNKVDTCILPSVKINKKYVPIASKATTYPCCVDYKKTPKQILEEMFNRLDINMKKEMCLLIHNVDEKKLMEMFDGQLSSWNELEGSQYPRLPLLYTICERLLMRKETMVKFFDVYKNGHTVLDRAVLTCYQSPLVARYLTECMMRALPHLVNTTEFSLDKIDSLGYGVLHRAASRGDQCATALAGILSIAKSSIFNINRLNAEGYSPLHIACSRHISEKPDCPCSCLYTAHVLLKHGLADPNVKDRRSGNTALHIAIDAPLCALNLIHLLTKHGAKTCIKNYGGATALDLARTASRSKPHYPKSVIDFLKKSK